MTTKDKHGNLTAREGCDRCVCGNKYWEDDACIDCKRTIQQARLEIHREVWDMPTLAESHPEILQWLAKRYDVDFDMAGQVVVMHRVGGMLFRVEHMDTFDVREAVDRLLQRAVLAAGIEHWTDATESRGCSVCGYSTKVCAGHPRHLFTPERIIHEVE